MTPDTLDRIGRRAAAALLADLEDLDTEAALGSLLDGGAAPEPAPSPDRRSRRWIAVAAPAAAVAAVAAVVGGLVGGGGSSDEVRTAEAPAIDPADYGPVIGRLVSQQDPNLVAEVHGPELLGAADQVAIVVTGAQPGRQYGASQCVRGSVEEVHPATACGDLQIGTVGDDGSATWVVRLPAVFGGTIPRQLNDCRTDGCELRIDTLIQDDEPDAGVPGTRFLSAADPSASGEEPAPSPWIPLRFDLDVEVAVPTMTVERGGAGSVAVAGEQLAPGRYDVVYEGWSTGAPEPLRVIGPEASVGLGEVVVDDDDGTFAITIELPATITDTSSTTTDGDGTVLPPATVGCTTPTAFCWLRLQPAEPLTPDGLPVVLPEPVAPPSP